MKIEEVLSSQIVKKESLTGGCIADIQLLSFENGSNVVCKSVSNAEMLESELLGLKELSLHEEVKVPKVLHRDKHSLYLEYLSLAPADEKMMKNFGQGLAKLHKKKVSRYGFSQDIYLGHTKQKNIWSSDWGEFFYQYRINYISDLIADKYQDDTFQVLSKKHQKDIISLCNQENEGASLVHGDLWSGNYLPTKRGVFLIDPAAFYAEREFEFGILTLFGGFSKSFFDGYQKEYPFRNGYQKRIEIYKLYHILNHYYLFGTSYKLQAIELYQSLF